MLNSLLSLLPALTRVLIKEAVFCKKTFLGEKKPLLWLPRACSNDLRDTEIASSTECETNLSLKDKCHF